MNDLTCHEKEKIRCELRNRGQGPANDELMSIVRSKPNTFVDLLVSLKVNHNESLLAGLWAHIETYFVEKNIPDEVHILRDALQQGFSLHLQGAQGAFGDGHSKTGSTTNVGRLQLHEGSGSTTNVGRLQLHEGSESTTNEGRLHLQEGSGDARPRRSDATGDTHSETLMTDNSSSSGLSFAESSLSFTDENNLEEKEVNDLDIAVVEALGKELEKLQIDGKPAWEHVLRYVNLKITMREKKECSRSTNPGETFLNLLGDKGLKIDQLKEALLMKNLREANQILIGEKDNLNINNQIPKQPGIRKIESTQKVSPTAGISSENEDQSRRRESKETNEIDSPIAFSPSDTSVTSSVFTSGSNVSGRSTYTFSSIGVLSPRERISSSISTQETSICSLERRSESLNSTRPIETVGAPEKTETAGNPDLEIINLKTDVRRQPEVFGNTSMSLDNIPIHDWRQAENSSLHQSRGLAEIVSENKSHLTKDNLLEEVSQDQSQFESNLRAPGLENVLATDAQRPNAYQGAQTFEQENDNCASSGREIKERGDTV